jgi:hydroxymethylpyrimidine pyrophosphatase-like HAD family hydrolase
MHYVALAAGFDGTLAREGRCDEKSIDALRALAATGRKLILVTSRELRSLLEIFPEVRVFDYVIAENGAVMHRPAARASAILAQAPSEILVQELHRRRVPLSVGSAVLTTDRAHQAVVADAIEKLQLDLQLIGNGSALIVLPTGVNKATGVRAALRELGLSQHNLVAIGDAENDLELFKLAEYSVAVHNAHADLKSVADRVTEGSFGDGFVELAEDLIATDLREAVGRSRITLGVRDDREAISIRPCKSSLLISGPIGSGKAALCRDLLKQLLEQQYQSCVIGVGVSGGYPVMPHVAVFGDLHEVPRLTQILEAIEKPACNVIIDLAALQPEARSAFAEALMLQLQALHDRAGRPHAVIVDQAHHLLRNEDAAHLAAKLPDVTMIYTSTDAALLPREILDSVQMIVSFGEAIAAREQLGRILSAVAPLTQSASLGWGEAFLWIRNSTDAPIKLQCLASRQPDGVQPMESGQSHSSEELHV